MALLLDHFSSSKPLSLVSLFNFTDTSAGGLLSSKILDSMSCKFYFRSMA